MSRTFVLLRGPLEGQTVTMDDEGDVGPIDLDAFGKTADGIVHMPPECAGLLFVRPASHASPLPRTYRYRFDNPDDVLEVPPA